MSAASPCEFGGCDVCGAAGYVETCQACGGSHCATCHAAVPGSIVEVPVCSRCAGRADVQAIVDRYSPALRALMDRRNAEIRELEKTNTSRT